MGAVRLRALLACGVFLAAAAVVALRAADSRGEASAVEVTNDPEPASLR